MSGIIYPPVMGLFCTGYVLHLIWRAWERRRTRLVRQWFMSELSARQEAIFVVWESLEQSGSGK